MNSILDKYRNHLSIVEIHTYRNLQSSSNSIPFSTWGSEITPKEIKTILKPPNSKKEPGVDKIPTKLSVKLVSDGLAEPLPITINDIISATTFPNDNKIASVVTFEKKTDRIYVISNRPVSLLNCFSKICEILSKNKLVKSMSVHISPSILAYRKNYNTQCV